MDRPTGPRTFEEFRPSSEWISDDNSETIIVKLPGFKKEQIKVKIDNYRNLRISGYGPLPGYRWRHFQEDFGIPDTLDVSHIRAKFENETLYVTIPKFITHPQAQEPPRAIEKAPAEPKPSTAQTLKPEAAKLDDPKPREATEAKEKEKEKAIETAPAEPKPIAAQTQKPETAKLDDPKPREATEAKEKAIETAPAEPKPIAAQTQKPEAAKLDDPKPREATEAKEKAIETALAEPKPSVAQTQKPKAAKVDDPKPREATEANKEKEKEKAPYEEKRVASDDQKKVVEERVDEGKEEGEVMGSGDVGMRPGKSPVKAMNGVGRMMEGLQDKPSQLLMNVGAAVIVLVTIGIYLVYKVRGVTG